MIPTDSVEAYSASQTDEDGPRTASQDNRGQVDPDDTKGASER